MKKKNGLETWFPNTSDKDDQDELAMLLMSL